MTNTVVIIGSGMAGYNLARELRRSGSDRPVVVVCNDAGAAYLKPQLSNALSSGKSAEQLISQQASALAEQIGVTIHPSTHVTRVDVASREVHCEAEAGPFSIGYADLVFATGARPNALAVEIDGTPWIRSVNHLEDFRALHERARTARAAVVVGAGLIGVELADDMAKHGLATHLISVDPMPLARLLPAAAQTYLRDCLTGNGIQFHGGTTVARITETSDGCANVLLTEGATLAADLIVIATGLSPRIDLATSAGLAVDRGIVTDEFLQTSNERVYAIGDCAAVQGQVQMFVAPLLQQARALAKTLAGERTSVRYQTTPIAVKSGSCPVRVVAPAPVTTGEWIADGIESGMQLRFVDDVGIVRGFAALGAASANTASLIKQLGTSMADRHA